MRKKDSESCSWLETWRFKATCSTLKTAKEPRSELASLEPSPSSLAWRVFSFPSRPPTAAVHQLLHQPQAIRQLGVKDRKRIWAYITNSNAGNAAGCGATSPGRSAT